MGYFMIEMDADTRLKTYLWNDNTHSRKSSQNP